MKLHDHDRRGVLGISGAGKSHYVKRRIVQQAERVVVWDLAGEYADTCDLDEVSLAEFLEEPQLLSLARCRLAVVPDWEEQKELAKGFKSFFVELKRAGEATESPRTVCVVEETSLLRPYADGVLVAMATQSRHWHMPLVLVSQRATMQPPGARSQWSQLVSFRQSDPADIDALAERIGEDKAEEVRHLPRRRFVVWTEQENFESKEQS